jgi:hypothetical protein
MCMYTILSTPPPKYSIRTAPTTFLLPIHHTKYQTGVHKLEASNKSNIHKRDTFQCKTFTKQTQNVINKVYGARNLFLQGILDMLIHFRMTSARVVKGKKGLSIDVDDLDVDKMIRLTIQKTLPSQTCHKRIPFLQGRQNTPL